MMIKRLIGSSLLIFFISLSLSASAKDFAGVTVPDTIKYGGKSLSLNGVGLRSKLFIKLYVASLYLTEKSKDADKIIVDSSPMAIRLAITSKLISVEKMKKATLEGFTKTTKGKITPIKPQIDQLLATFDKGVKPGDIYEFINMPGSGVHVLRNGIKVTQIGSQAFKQALFGIWLSKTPVQSSLKGQLLGK